ncbi:origin recognition complex subunit 5 C-terminus-domain-containing protein [Xylariaceae sp. FL0804]|nr:origin recognition complex subunit 5 C-terminus-domain-containing protein [Xylariaceae sp. FL0804]
MPATIFELPDDLLASLAQSFPCREPQTRALATLLSPRAAPCRNLIVHGAEATGKSAVTAGLLRALRGEDDDDDENDDEEKNDEAASKETKKKQKRHEHELNYAVVQSAECVTARHLFERTVGLVRDALRWDGPAPGRCETLAALTVELAKMLDHAVAPEPRPRRFVLVFDGIDRQREAPPTLLPALARLSEIIPYLSTVFIMTAPAPLLLRVSACPHLYFPPYTKAQFVSILAGGGGSSSSASLLSPPPPLPNSTPAETADLWARFVAAVHDALARPAGPRTLPALRGACAALWPRFTAPVAAGTHRAREFSRLLVAARQYFHDERLLQPGILSARPAAAAGGVAARSSSNSNSIIPNTPTTASQPTTTTAQMTTTTTTTTNMTNTTTTDLSTTLPPTARLLLIAAYLASHNPPRHDVTLFSTWHPGRRRRRRRGGGGAAVSSLRQQSHFTPQAGARRGRRRIARRLLGPGAFVLERMVAIYAATRREWTATPTAASVSHTPAGGGDGDAAATVDGDVGMALATLASLRLLVRVGGGAGTADPLDRGGRWRVNVGWEVVRAVGRSLGVEVEEWLVE